MHEAAAPPDQILAEIAERNHGVILTADALALGISHAGLSRRVARGSLKRLHQGVYAIAGMPSSPRQTLLAACRWGGPGTAASHRAAGYLWELDGFSDCVLEISSPRRLRSSKIVSHPVTSLPLEDTTQIDGIPVTKVERTLVDLAGVLEVDRLEDALDCCLRRRQTTVNRLRLRLRAETGRRGIGKLRDLLTERDDRGHPSASRFETRLNRLFLTAGLPALREYTVWDGGEFVARVDFCYPEAKLIVEADGYRWHSHRRAWQRDRDRRNRLTELGWRVLQVTWEDLIRRPDRTVDRVRSLLQPQLPLR